MAEKNDDIKNLFLNLGLNPSDYHEIRTAPSANATVSEAPRRWSLLQAATIKPLTPAVPLPIVAAVAVPAAAPVSAVPAALFSSPQDRATASSNVAAALFAVANDIALAEAGKLPAAEMPMVEAPVVVPTPAPSAAASSGVSNAADDLRSLFQSVKEPQTVTELPNLMDSWPERRTDQLHGRPAVALTPTQRVAGLPSASGPLLMPSVSRLLPDDEAETRIEQAPMLSRLGPIPSLPPSAAPAAQPAAAEGRLRFAAVAADPVVAAHGDSLQDVFRRLSRDNRG